MVTKEEKAKGKISWDVRVGCHEARCSCTNPPRILSEDEVKVIWISQSAGDLKSKGKAKCKICGATYKWNTSDY